MGPSTNKKLIEAKQRANNIYRQQPYLAFVFYIVIGIFYIYILLGGAKWYIIINTDHLQTQLSSIRNLSHRNELNKVIEKLGSQYRRVTDQIVILALIITSILGISLIISFFIFLNYLMKLCLQS